MLNIAHNPSLFFIGIISSNNTYWFSIPLCLYFVLSTPICGYDGSIITFPFLSATPYKLFFFNKYNPFLLSIIFISSYITLNLVDVSVPKIPYFPLLFIKKSDVDGKYFISSYFVSNTGCPVLAVITPYCSSFIIIIISWSIAFWSEYISDVFISSSSFPVMPNAVQYIWFK